MLGAAIGAMAAALAMENSAFIADRRVVSLDSLFMEPASSSSIEGRSAGLKEESEINCWNDGGREAFERCPIDATVDGVPNSIIDNGLWSIVVEVTRVSFCRCGVEIEERTAGFVDDTTDVPSSWTPKNVCLVEMTPPLSYLLTPTS